MLYALAMTSLAFWKAVVSDKSNFLERSLALIEDAGLPYCVISGVAVNAYAEPVVTQDLDIVLAVEDLDRARRLFEAEFQVQDFEHSLKIYDPGSQLQLQIQKDPVLADVLSRAERREVMDLLVPVASPDDLLRLKAAAASDTTRRPSKRQKDLADIARLLEAFPDLEPLVPAAIKEKLVH